MSMELVVRDLSLSLDDLPILKGVSFDVPEGSFLSLLGPSGCGKTTLLKTLGGLFEPQEGMILLESEEITHKKAHQRETVIVFQDLRLFPHLSVEDNVAYGLKLRGMKKNERRQRAADLLKRVGLEGFEKRRVQELSGGEKQRIALIRALAVKPKLLLLDEPFSALDKNLREEAKNLVLSLHRDFGITTILVTHDQEEALALSDEVAVMFGGRIHQKGTPESIYQSPKTREVASYFGHQAFVRGYISEGRFISEALILDVSRTDGEVDLLIPHQALEFKPGDFEVHVESIQFQGDNYLVGLRKGTLQWKKEVSEKPTFQAGTSVNIQLHPQKLMLYEVNQ